MEITPSDNENPEQGSIDYLMANSIPVHNFKALSREEIYNWSNRISRKPELDSGVFVISEDFDEPLPDDFWLGGS